jgi:hypothetical protein
VVWCSLSYTNLYSSFSQPILNISPREGKIWTLLVGCFLSGQVRPELRIRLAWWCIAIVIRVEREREREYLRSGMAVILKDHKCSSLS